ncbi:hypothetical protein [Polyangium jinanense]|uniref:Uncharacterized protein n=1 Tax=Polyangium jinanense TaxID=2829994 RepID=A0A9X3XFU2_9BACT|nr:hypothetical protein [Polyangium jinanense]MDC3956778.1 hypothetical protein [Polyangium jinanense]MDC3987226.1 hypothetical protein [Polyangium jinanense]
MKEKRGDKDVRAAQAEVLAALARRLSKGDTPLPADLMAKITAELELRIDDEAISAAWAEQGNEEPTSWRGNAARASRRGRGRDVRDIELFARAARDLEALEAAEREEVSLEIDALAFDPVPRGVMALHGRKDGHLQNRMGMRRLLYKVQGMVVTVVAITG